MSKTVYFRQCRLVKPIATGHCVLTTWIPETFALPGRVVKLREEDGSWDDGWRVEQAGAYRVAEDDLYDPHQGVKAHRRATGDALPKMPKA